MNERLLANSFPTVRQDRFDFLSVGRGGSAR
jgi:hypothetical protein